MTVSQMRAAINKVYPTPKWQNKVAHMPDHQIIAIYFDFLKRNVFEEARKARAAAKRRGPAVRTNPVEDTYIYAESQQLTLDLGV
jgi:hypothetical protein